MSGAAIIGAAGASQARADSPGQGLSEPFIKAHGREPLEVIDDAPPHSTIWFDPSEPMTLEETIVIDKPLTLVGLHARMAEGLEPIPLVLVEAEGVRLTDFELHGNDDWEDWLQDGRQPLVVIYAGKFSLERGSLSKASQHGILVRSNVLEKDIHNGVVRDLLVRDLGRDGVSLEGRPEGSISNMLVENVQVFGSRLRGAVEACDGTDNVTFRNIYAEDCAYAADIMHDHGNDYEVTNNHAIEHVHAVRCQNVIRTANNDLGHTGVTIRDVTAEQCRMPVSVSNTAGVLISGVRVRGHEGDRPVVAVSNCRGVLVNDVMLLSGELDMDAIMDRDCEGVRKDEFVDARVVA